MKILVFISALILSFLVAWTTAIPGFAAETRLRPGPSPSQELPSQRLEDPRPKVGTLTSQESPAPLIREIRERVREGVRELRQTTREGVQERKEEIKENVPEQRTKFRSEVRDLRSESRDQIRVRKEEFRALSEERKKEFKDRLEEVRKGAKDEIERRKEELKERLKQVRDEQKKRIVEKIAGQLNTLNERIMDHFSEVLDRLEKVLVNIKSRTDKAEARGWDVSAVRTMITAAEEAIASARAAIKAQSAKTYIPEITGEEDKLKVEVGDARQALHKDLAAVKGIIRAAYEAVRRVATTLAQIPRVDEELLLSPTPSPTPTPTPSPTEIPLITP